MAAAYGALMIQCSATQHSRRLVVNIDGSGTLKPRRASASAAVVQVPVVGSRRRRRRRGDHVMVQARSGGEYMERALGAVGYVLPMLDGMQYGRYVFAQYPVTEALFRPLFPLLRLYSSIPFSNFVLFFTLYLALVRNPRVGRFVRFNAMQACVLDVLIVLPLIAQRILSPRSGFALDLLVIFYNAIFVALLAAVVFAIVSCLLGKTPRLPIVADAAENQLF
ncbi:hypothetical protein GOP47_0016219 [Adiantum capillus-veneris]|uniref:Protein TIC 20 n=1 Tax=Adiantum capillus-veneris TaxID=13818 RepID=A0A9D4UI45_ADICA|nr:hypothetical protein GOP47_0016219 [Adiantum capillus-veneris]